MLVRLVRKATIWSISASLSPVGCTIGVLFGSGLPPPAMVRTASFSVAALPSLWAASRLRLPADFGRRAA